MIRDYSPAQFPDGKKGCHFYRKGATVPHSKLQNRGTEGLHSWRGGAQEQGAQWLSPGKLTSLETERGEVQAESQCQKTINILVLSNHEGLVVP